MAKFTLTHEIHCDVDAFWKLYFDRTFAEALYKEALGFPKYAILEDRDTAAELSRTVSAEPKVELPGALKKIFGDGFAYTERTTFDKVAKQVRWTVTPSAMADKIKNEGAVRVEPIGEKRVRRIVDILMEAKIFGLGGLIEGTAEKSLRDGWNKSADFMNQWIAQGKSGV